MDFKFTNSTSASQIEIFNTEYLPIIEGALALGVDTRTYMINNGLTVPPIDLRSLDALCQIVYYASNKEIILPTNTYVSEMQRWFAFLFNIDYETIGLTRFINMAIEKGIREGVRDELQRLRNVGEIEDDEDTY